MWILRWLFAIIVVFFLVGFLSQNSGQIVDVRLFGWSWEGVPLSYAMFIAGMIGYLLCLIVALTNHLRLRSQLAALRRKNREMQIELDRLRNFALEGELPEGESASMPEDES